MKKSTVSALSLGVVASLAFATPAFATPYDGSDFDLGNVHYWGLNGNEFSVNDTWASDAWMTANPQYQFNIDPEYQYYNTNWDGVGFLNITVGSDLLSYIGGVDCDKTDEGSDVVVVCPVETINGFDVHPEIRYYDSQMMSRIVWIIENKSGADITATVASGFSSECDGSGFMETSDGDSGSDATGWDLNASNWSVQRGTEDGGFVERCGIETAAWAGPEATVDVTTELSSDLDGQDMSYDITLKAGKKIAFAYFFGNMWTSDENADPNDAGSPYQINRAANFDTAVTAAGTMFGSWSSTLSTGIASDLYVANWMAEPPATLANTGVDAAEAGMLAGGAALAALAGVGVMVAVRRRAQA